MTNLENELRTLMRSKVGALGSPAPLRRDVLRQTRRRQLTTVAVSGLVAAIVATGVIAGLRPLARLAPIPEVPRRPGETAGRPTTPALKANGKIAFLRFDPHSVLERDGAMPEGAMFVVNPDRTGLVRLVGRLRVGADPTWSPDGSRIAFSARREDASGIFVVNADGSGLTRITSCLHREKCQSESAPFWAPDGRIAFSRYWDRTGDSLWTVNADGTGLRLLRDDLSLGSPSWSPDGRLIAGLGSVSPDDEDVILLLDARDGEVVRSLRPAGLRLPSSVSWSPDGRWLAFNAFGEERHEEKDGIYLIRPDGTDLRLLTSWSCPSRSACSATGPAWSPDSRLIVFTRDVNEPGSLGFTGDLFTIVVETGRIRRLTGGRGLDCCASWQPRAAKDVPITK